MPVASWKGAKLKATRLHSLIVRSAGHCENPACDYVCPCPEAPERHPKANGCKLQAAHIIGRARSVTRTDLRNALCLCASCHAYYGSHPYEFKELVDEVQGAGVYEEMKADSNRLVKAQEWWPAEVERLERVARERGVL